MNKGKVAAIPDEVVISKIFVVRGRRVMIDTDIAHLYGVQTKRLNEQVKRNNRRFPNDFMFQLTQEEKEKLIATFSQLERLKYSPTLPFVFTEHGIVMLASVLNNERAIEVNVQIVRVFIQMREMLFVNKDILIKLDKLEQKATQHDGDLKLIFKYLKQLLSPPNIPLRKIGFKRKDED